MLHFTGIPEPQLSNELKFPRLLLCLTADYRGRLAWFFAIMKTFTKEEIIAVYKAADLMVLADNKVMSEEVATVDEAMEKLGIISLSALKEIKALANQITQEECYGLIAFLDVEQKRFVSAMLGAISSSDGDIDDSELELWRKICFNCDLPRMSNRQAIHIFQSYKLLWNTRDQIS